MVLTRKLGRASVRTLFERGMGVELRKLDLVDSAKYVAGMAVQGHVTEAYAVRYLATNIGESDLGRLRDAVITAKADPDVIPLVPALLERAVRYVENPPPRPPVLRTN